MIPSSKIIDPKRVRELMAAMQPKDAPAPVVVRTVRLTPGQRLANAYEMIKNTQCTLGTSSLSWKVSIKGIIKYAKENNLPLLWQRPELDQQAKAIVDSGKYTNVRHGLRVRVAYQLALKHGVSKACRLTGVCREGLYAHCRRYEIPTPLQATGLSR
jgi:hypothetical protein